MWGLLLFVLLPVLVCGTYLHVFAANQYVSEFRFTIRRPAVAQGTQPSVVSALSGGNNSLAAMIQDSEVINQYLRSRQAMDDLRGTLDVAEPWSRAEWDWLFKLDPSRSAERRLRYWRRMVVPYLDTTTGITTVRVWAFDPEDASRIATALRDQAEGLVNRLGRRSQEDWLRQAERDASAAESDLHRIRLAMADYRNQNQLLFPAMNAQVISQVEARLREALADLRGQLATQTSLGVAANSLQMEVLRRRIAGLEDEVRRIRSELTGNPGPGGAPADASLATRLSGYAALEVEERMATQRLERVQNQLSLAQAEAARQLIYLTTFISPVPADASEWPRRWLILLQVAVVGMLVWALAAFALRFIREHAR